MITHKKEIFTKIAFMCLNLLLLNLCSALALHEILLENNQVCKASEKEIRFELGIREDSVVIVGQKSYFESWTGRYDFKCPFRVKALDDNYGHPQGIYVVVQNLNFRRNSTTGECIDYLLVEEVRKFPYTRKHRSAKFCDRLGSFSFDETNGLGKDLAPNGFVAYSGEVSVKIYVGKKRLQANEKLEMSVAFTAYNPDCPVYKKGDWRHCARDECIWDGLFGDGIQNCPYMSCLDEDCQGSGEGITKFSSGTGTMVTFITIASILTALSSFCLCICLCKKSQRLCWSKDQIRRPPNRPPTPSAPPEISSTTVIKDSPPTYESLFPSQ